MYLIEIPVDVTKIYHEGLFFNLSSNVLLILRKQKRQILKLSYYISKTLGECEKNIKSCKAAFESKKYCYREDFYSLIMYKSYIIFQTKTSLGRKNRRS